MLSPTMSYVVTAASKVPGCIQLRMLRGGGTQLVQVTTYQLNEKIRTLAMESKDP